ncbi:MAG: hypothetical protein ACRDE2_05675 [Chitinophagaceae bacterium]
MKTIIAFLLIGILSYITGLYYPWWSLAVVAFVITLIIPQKPFASFLTAFVSLFVLWFCIAFFKDLANDHILGNRISELFLQKKSPVLLAVITGFIGAIVAGFAALSASFLRAKKNRVKQPSIASK